jgi:hypothetical protein
MPRIRPSPGIPPIYKEPPIWEYIKKLKRLPPRTGNGPLSVLEKLAILDGMRRGLSVSRIASEYEMPLDLVKGFKSEILGDPLSIFNLPVIRRF